jgi:hypothetical protein
VNDEVKHNLETVISFLNISIHFIIFNNSLPNTVILYNIFLIISVSVALSVQYIFKRKIKLKTMS